MILNIGVPTSISPFSVCIAFVGVEIVSIVNKDLSIPSSKEEILRKPNWYPY